MTLTGPITVFGGSGFLGSRVVRRLAEAGTVVRIAVRDIANAALADRLENVVVVPANVMDIHSVVRAASGATAVVNCVSLYHEHGPATFEAVHVTGAENVARAAGEGGAKKLVHVSGIGADARSSSPYIAARGLGETRVRAAFPDATIVRPSVMFAEKEGILETLRSLISTLPVVPMFGDGTTRLQPVHGDDVAAAIATILDREDTLNRIFELGGPDVLEYRTLLGLVRKQSDSRALFAPLPFAVWRVLAAATSPLSQPPVTRGQIELMRHDNTVDTALDGFAQLGITPRSIVSVLARE